MSTVGLIAHTPIESGNEMERDAVALALVLMVHDHRLLLHASPDIIVPLLLAGEAARAQLVLEDAVRRPHPMVMLPSPRPEGAEEALYARIEIGSPFGNREGVDKEPRFLSLIEQFEALGVVDTRWMRPANAGARLETILEQEAPAAILAMGWSSEMEWVASAAEDHGLRHDIPLVVAGPPLGPMASSRVWRDLEEVADTSLPEIDDLLRDDSYRSEEFMDAWRVARRRARTVLAAEALAIRMGENLRGPQRMT